MFTQTIETAESTTTVSLKVPPQHRALITLIPITNVKENLVKRPVETSPVTNVKENLVKRPVETLKSTEAPKPTETETSKVSPKSTEAPKPTETSKAKEELSKLSDKALIALLAKHKEDRQISNRDLGMALGQHGPSLGHNQKDGIWPGEISRLLRKLVNPSPDRRNRIINYLASV